MSHSQNQSYFSTDFEPQWLVTLKKKKIGLSCNIMQHFVHFEVEGIYNFKLVNVYRIHSLVYLSMNNC